MCHILVSKGVHSAGYEQQFPESNSFRPFGKDDINSTQMLLVLMYSILKILNAVSTIFEHIQPLAYTSNFGQNPFTEL